MKVHSDMLENTEFDVYPGNHWSSQRWPSHWVGSDIWDFTFLDPPPPSLSGSGHLAGPIQERKNSILVCQLTTITL